MQRVIFDTSQSNTITKGTPHERATSVSIKIGDIVGLIGKPKTNGDQVPWTEDGIQRRQRVLFGGGKPALTPSAQSALAQMRVSEAADDWGAAERTTSILALEMRQLTMRIAVGYLASSKKIAGGTEPNAYERHAAILMYPRKPLSQDHMLPISARSASSARPTAMMAVEEILASLGSHGNLRNQIRRGRSTATISI